MESTSDVAAGVGALVVGVSSIDVGWQPSASSSTVNGRQVNRDDRGFYVGSIDDGEGQWLISAVRLG